ncbi:MAG: outer membrane beta-barrel protein [Ignavibacteria bacterium]|jgi:hypothetical protein|nr:outer membrane beta-barrel protein [Ignavibacteria bacterium]
MKIKFYIVLLLILTASEVYSQPGNKSDIYAGMTYNLVFFTNPDVDNVYPSFDFREISFKSELNFFVGYNVNDVFSVEFSPSFTYSKSSASDGFYYPSTIDPSENTYYYPYNAYLLAIPLNAKIKIYPFSMAKSYFMGGLFFGIAGGPMVIREEYDVYEYPDEFRYNPISYRRYDNTIWTGNLILSLGYNSNAQFNYGFEIGYRIVPLPVDREYPLAIDLAPNMNAVLLGIKIGFNL